MRRAEIEMCTLPDHLTHILKDFGITDQAYCTAFFNLDDLGLYGDPTRRLRIVSLHVFIS